DIGFDASLNPYRGCEHGCIYCYARPTHEYFGLSAGLDFETRIMVKEQAPELLREALMATDWEPQTVALSGNTDCYQPVERHLKLTRRCLEVFAEFRNPVTIISKNYLVTRDIDVLQRFVPWQGVAVTLSVTSLDGDLAGRLEPRAARPVRRLEAVRQLAQAGIPVGVMVAPIIPGLNDTEVPSILQAAKAAGARRAGYTIVRLPHGVAPLFEAWLEQHYPQRRQKVLNRLRDMRGGKLSDPRFGHRHRGEGVFAEQIKHMFALTCRRLGLNTDRSTLSATAFQRPGPRQMTLF
ncbi:MAG TPA: PA0069 family radical SAM protein, partial [Candidatus Xenobia bacterium]